MAGLAAAVVLLAQAKPVGSRPVGHFHDDGIYLLTAKSLAEGRGYRVGHLPGEPPQTKYPPLYPAALAAVWATFPEFPGNVPALQWVGVIAGAVAVAGGYGYLVRFGYADRPVALLAATSVATAPAFLGMCCRLMAEMPFAALVVAALWRVESRVGDEPPTLLRSVADRVLTGVIIALPAMCRLPGVILVPVAVVVFWRAGRPVRAVALGSALILAPWVVWVAVAGRRFAADPVTGYYTDYLGWWADIGPAGFVRVAGINLFQILQATAARSAEGLTATAGLFDAPLLLALVGLAAVPGWLRDLRAGRPLAVFLAAYLGLVAVWPWPSARFVLPVQVFAAAYLFRPLALVPGHRWIVLPVVGANLWFLGVVVNRPPDGDIAATERLLAWVRAETPADAVIASPADPIVALYAGRTAFNPVVARPGPMFYGLPGEPLPSPDQVRANLRAFRAGFVVHIPVTAGDESPYFALYAALERAGVLRPVYADGRFAAYRVVE